ncbi:hypothetical protein PM082_010990 [Marasmius tenuissimus]|nr:hypothetical protein PM082_010990 [Marasmius tenuissimus]
MSVWSLRPLLKPSMEFTPGSSFPQGDGHIESLTWVSSGQSVVYTVEVELDETIRFPPGHSKATSRQLPTVLFVHDGPYRSHCRGRCSRLGCHDLGYWRVSRDGRWGSSKLEMAISGMNLWILASPSTWAESTHNDKGTSEDPLEVWNHLQDPVPMSLVSHIDPRTSFLILRGEKDERAPVPQAVGLYRGSTCAGKRVQSIVYPREGYGFVERKHATDVCEQVLQCFGRWF